MSQVTTLEPVTLLRVIESFCSAFQQIAAMPTRDTQVGRIHVRARVGVDVGRVTRHIAFLSQSTAR